MKKIALCDTAYAVVSKRFSGGVQTVGGPRAGSGGAVSVASRVRSTGCTAYAKRRQGGAMTTAAGGGALMFRHNAQSSVCLLATTSPLSFLTRSLVMPEAEHSSSIDCGLIMGDAIAAPIASAKHISTHRARRVMERVWAKVCMDLVSHRAQSITTG